MTAREKKKGKNDRLSQMEEGEGRDRMASHRRDCCRSCRDSAAPNHTQGGGTTAAFIDLSTVGDDEGRLEERKLKEERISKECGFVSLARTDFSSILDELQYISVLHHCLRGQMVIHITALHSPCPT